MWIPRSALLNTTMPAGMGRPPELTFPNTLPCGGLRWQAGSVASRHVIKRNLKSLYRIAIVSIRQIVEHRNRDIFAEKMDGTVRECGRYTVEVR